MKIEIFLKKINYKVFSGEIYSGEDLKDKLLYWIHFTDKSEKNKGKLLISAKNQHIYYIQYTFNKEHYVFHHNMINIHLDKKKISLKKMLELLEK